MSIIRRRVWWLGLGTVLVLLTLLAGLSWTARAQEPTPQGTDAGLGTAFTYQGTLYVFGQPANGPYNFTFKLYDAPSGGNQIGTTITKTVQIDNAFFSTVLDFGDVFDGNERWLEIEILEPTSKTWLLFGRFRLTATPHALYARKAGSVPWSGLTGVPAGFADNTDNDTLGGLSCSSGQVAKWNGSRWVCSNDETGGTTSGNFWSLTGNSGTNANTHFLGTTDKVTLTLKVNNTTALRIAPSRAVPNIIGGYAGNVIGSGVTAGTIGGGGREFAHSDYACVPPRAPEAKTNYPCINQVTADNGTVSGGYGNRAGGFAAMVSGGYGNWAMASGSSIGGGAMNHVLPIPSQGPAAGGPGGGTIGGGGWNSVLGRAATIGGGHQNMITGTATLTDGLESTIAGGGWNHIYGQFSTIGGGFTNTITGSASTIAGGWSNQVVGDYATVGGGENNRATAEDATVAGGVDNVAGASGAFVGGGGTDGVLQGGNKAQAPGSAIVGGLGNTVEQNAWTSFIGGGLSNLITGTAQYATIAGGYNITVTGQYAAVGGGKDNAVGASAVTVAGGEENTASGERSTVGGGFRNIATGEGATIPGGYEARADLWGQLAYAGGSFGQPGTAQFSLYVLRREIPMEIGETWNELFLDGSGQRLSVPMDRTMAFDILVAAQDPYGLAMGWSIQGAISNVDGTTMLLAPPLKQTFGTLGWDVEVVADDANDALVIQVTGTGDGPIRWVAVVRTAEVGW